MFFAGVVSLARKLRGLEDAIPLRLEGAKHISSGGGPRGWSAPPHSRFTIASGTLSPAQLASFNCITRILGCRTGGLRSCRRCICTGSALLRATVLIPFSNFEQIRTNYEDYIQRYCLHHIACFSVAALLLAADPPRLSSDALLSAHCGHSGGHPEESGKPTEASAARSKAATLKQAMVVKTVTLDVVFIVRSYLFKLENGIKPWRGATPNQYKCSDGKTEGPSAAAKDACNAIEGGELRWRKRSLAM